MNSNELLTREVLVHKRCERLETARQVVQKHHDINNDLSGSCRKVLVFPNLDEEQQLLRFYYFELQRSIQLVRYPHNVYSTAMTFFQLFYLQHAIFEHDPSTILFVSIFLAAKTENFHVTIQALAEKLKSPEVEIVKQYELKLATCLGYRFLVRNSYDPLYGIFLDSQSHVPNHQILYRAYQMALKRLHKSYLTDLYFIHPPAYIALVLYKQSCEELGIDLSVYIRDTLDAKHYNSAIECTADILSVIDTVSEPRDLDFEQLNACQSPMSNPRSYLYQIVQRQELPVHDSAETL